MRKTLLAVSLLLAACTTVPDAAPPVSVEPVTEAEMRTLMKPLASDEFEGRMPGTRGETKTLAFLVEKLHAAGVEGASGGDHPYLQPFEAVSTRQVTPERAKELMDNPNVPSGQVVFMMTGAAMPSFVTHNVVGKIPGRNSDGKAVVVMGHWDHLGICRPEGEEDRICNGAVDNASGIAAIISVARRVKALGLDRDVWFVLTSAEEWGLFGAKAFVNDPPLPLDSIVAGFNLDTIAIAPAGMPVAMVAEENTPLAGVVDEAAAAVGRKRDGDEGARAFLRRQDGWALAEKGVPMIMAGGSFADMEKVQAFLAGNYHEPGDELTDDLDLGGAVDDANLHVELVRRAASRSYNPVKKGE